MGDSKSPMRFIAVACAVNIALDYLFMGFFHLGPVGAALGTTLSQAVSVVTALIVIKKRRSGVALRKADFRPNRQAMGQILKIGVPIALQDGLIQIAFIVITVIANQRGLTDAAAVGIVEEVISFVFLVPSTMLSTVSALGAQNIGAGKPQRAVLTLKYAVLMAAGFGLAVAILAQFIAEPIVGLFTPDANVIASGGQYLRGYIWDCVFAGVHSASAVISAPAENPVYPSCTISPLSRWRACRARIFPAAIFPTPCCLWGWPPPPVRFCPC